MTLNLSNIKHRKKSRKRVGRGNASGTGTYSARGSKGQRARSGGKKGLKYLGFKRTILNMPKFKGMKSLYSKNQIVKLSQLEKQFDNGAQINPRALLEKKLIERLNGSVKILTDFDITKSFEISNCLMSNSAKEKIIKAGGKVIEAEIISKT